jgi:hypothetical protein
MPRVFLAQTALDRWMAAGGVTLNADLLQFHAAPSVQLYINPAVVFRGVDGGGPDPYDILGQVKTTQELAQSGGDHFETSVVMGDTAYTVIPGFLTIPIGADGAETELDGSTWGMLVNAIETLGYT